MGGVDQSRLVRVEFVGQRERALAGHVFGGERAGHSLLVVVVAAGGVALAHRRGNDRFGQQEVGVGEACARLVGDPEVGVAGDGELRVRGLDHDAVTDERRVFDGHQRHREATDLERLEGGVAVDRDLVEVVVPVGHALGDALAGLRVGLVRGVHGQVREHPEGVAEAVDVVEVDVGDQGGVGQGDVVREELVSEVRAAVDQERFIRSLVADVDREPAPLDAALAGRRAGLTVTAHRRGPGGVAGPEQRDLHLSGRGRDCDRGRVRRGRDRRRRR